MGLADRNEVGTVFVQRVLNATYAQSTNDNRDIRKKFTFFSYIVDDLSVKLLADRADLYENKAECGSGQT